MVILFVERCWSVSAKRRARNQSHQHTVCKNSVSWDITDLNLPAATSSHPVAWPATGPFALASRSAATVFAQPVSLPDPYPASLESEDWLVQPWHPQ